MYGVIDGNMGWENSGLDYIIRDFWQDPDLSNPIERSPRGANFEMMGLLVFWDEVTNHCNLNFALDSSGARSLNFVPFSVFNLM
jgi:hypothetical protein